MRLDEALIREGLADKNQIQEALDYQRNYGGRLETHLYRFGYVDESSLVRALAKQFGCEGITLSRIIVDESVLKMIPPDVAWQKLVIPFDYEPDGNVLKIACENPQDKRLADELAELVLLLGEGEVHADTPGRIGRSTVRDERPPPPAEMCTHVLHDR